MFTDVLGHISLFVFLVVLAFGERNHPRLESVEHPSDPVSPMDGDVLSACGVPQTLTPLIDKVGPLIEVVICDLRFRNGLQARQADANGTNGVANGHCWKRNGAGNGDTDPDLGFFGASIFVLIQ